MDLLPKDVLLMMAIEDMDYQSVVALCKTHPKYNTIFCNNPAFWQRKLRKDYPDIDISNVTDFKGLFVYLQKKLKLSEKIEEGDTLYNKYSGDYLIRGNGGLFYSLFKDGKVIEKGLRQSFRDFPEFSPEYFSVLNTDMFVIGAKKIKEIAQNAIDNTNSFVLGNFNEKYPVEIESMTRSQKIGAKEESKRDWINLNKRAGSDMIAYFTKGGKIKVITN